MSLAEEGKPGRPLFVERYDAVLALKLDGRRNRDVCQELKLNRHQVSGIVNRLRESGTLPRLVPKISRPRKNPLHKPVKAAKPHRQITMPAIIPASTYTRGYRPRPVPVVDIPPPATPHVTLALRTGCAFPVNDGRPFLFCDAPTEGSPYCPHHRQRMYTVKAIPSNSKPMDKSIVRERIDSERFIITPEGVPFQ